MLQTIYPQNNISTNQQKFDNPRTLALTNKNDSIVYKIYKSMTLANHMICYWAIKIELRLFVLGESNLNNVCLN